MMKKICSMMLLCATILVASCQKDDDAPIGVSEVKLDKTTLSLVENTSGTLIATVNPDNADDATVTWSSSDATIAKVSEAGVVSALKVGEATITASAGGKTATCKVTVTAKVIAVTGVTLAKPATSIEQEKTEKLAFTIAPANATDQTVAWSSDKEAVAIVATDGTVTAVAVGEATITVTTKDGAKTATCKVTVTAKVIAVTGVTLTKTTATIGKGKTEKLAFTIAPANATDQTVTWSSDKEAVATVASDGTVTAVAAGEATITVTTKDGGKKATCKVTVPTEPAIGDFYLSDGTIISKDATLTAEQKAKCIGIVLKYGKDANDDCTYMKKDGVTAMTEIKGYVLALTDANDGSTCQWGSSGKEIGTQDNYSMQSFRGYEDTKKIKAQSSYSASAFPATYYAINYESVQAAPANSSGWFLPSTGQCEQWGSNKEVLLTSIQKALDNSSYSWKDNYWSSSEFYNMPNYRVWYIRTSGNLVTGGDKHKTDVCVRSCLAF